MCNISEYNEEKHYRNFAIWAAARAASRGHAGLTINVWSTALKNLNFKMDKGLNSEKFDKCYCGLIENLRNSVNNILTNGNLICFGRAAKFLAIYFKVMFRHTTSGSSPYDKYSQFAHPPIDRILLQNVARKFGSEVSWNRSNRLPAWTTLNEKCYSDIIKNLRNLLPEYTPLWKIEYYWLVAGD